MNMFVQSLIVVKEGSCVSSYSLFLTFLLPIRPPFFPSDYLSPLHFCPPSHHSFPLTSSIFHSQSSHLSFFLAFLLFVCLLSVLPSFLPSFLPFFYSSIYDPSIIHRFVFNTCFPPTVFLSLFTSPSFLPSHLPSSSMYFFLSSCLIILSFFPAFCLSAIFTSFLLFFLPSSLNTPFPSICPFIAPSLLSSTHLCISLLLSLHPSINLASLPSIPVMWLANATYVPMCSISLAETPPAPVMIQSCSHGPSGHAGIPHQAEECGWVCSPWRSN